MSSAQSENAAPAIKPLTQWQLIGRKFRKHRLARGALYLLVAMYMLAVFAEIFAPYPSALKNSTHAFCPPQIPHLNFEKGLYVDMARQQIDPVTLGKTYTLDEKDYIPLGFFVKGQQYELWGLIPWDRHFVGVNTEACKARGIENNATFYLLGADKYGRDIFSRTIYGARISLSIGILAIVITFILGVTIGGISGYVGGSTDNAIQRAIEIINAFPRLPLWLALGAAMPSDWSPLKTYFAITIVLSLLGWTRLARVVRGKILSLREEDYVTAATLIGAGHGRVIFRHLLPGFTSHIIVSLTLRVPTMILGETSLSFLGLGLRAPIVSWGVMLQDCMNMQAVAKYPWLLLPVVFIIITVLSFNFLGDGLRDAADPYAAK